MLAFLYERINEYNANNFLNELVESSKLLGVLEAKVADYHFNTIIVPMLRIKEAISSMHIEGTETTITDVLSEKLSPPTNNNFPRAIREYQNHALAIAYGSQYLSNNNFSDDFIQRLHSIMLTGITPIDKVDTVGRYKTADNYIINNVTGAVVFTPPPPEETQRYMNELLSFINNTADGINPLIKAAIIHSQFESIHPFEDGNGRVGRLLVSLYLYKAQLINFPFFYISEAISQDKAAYYSQLTGSRNGSYDAWIKYFLQKCIIQARKHIDYIDGLTNLHTKTKELVHKSINSTNVDTIIECIFSNPMINVVTMAEQIKVTKTQAKRYIDKLVELGILVGDNRKRGRTYMFFDLLELAKR